MKVSSQRSLQEPAMSKRPPSRSQAKLDAVDRALKKLLEVEVNFRKKQRRWERRLAAATTTTTTTAAVAAETTEKHDFDYDRYKKGAFVVTEEDVDTEDFNCQCVALTRRGNQCYLWVNSPGPKLCSRHRAYVDRKKTVPFGTVEPLYPDEKTFSDGIAPPDSCPISSGHATTVHVDVHDNSVSSLEHRVPPRKRTGKRRRAEDGVVETFDGTSPRRKVSGVRKTHTPRDCQPSSNGKHVVQLTAPVDAVVFAKSAREQCEYSEFRERCRCQAIEGTSHCLKHEGTCGVKTLPVAKETSTTEEDSYESYSEDSESSSASDLDLFSSSEEDSKASVARPFKQKEFVRLWRECESYYGARIDVTESSRRVRAANQQMTQSDSEGQERAPYGRLLPRATKVNSRVKCMYLFHVQLRAHLSLRLLFLTIIRH